MTLYDEAVTFLESEGWSVPVQTRAEVVRARRAAYADNSEHMTVWCPAVPDADDLHRREASLLQRFAEEARTPGAKFLLVESTQGLSTEFRRLAKHEFNVDIRVPIQFFDARFKWDDSPMSAMAGTAAQQLSRDGESAARRRTPQPFRAVGTGAVGDDLMTELARRFDSQSGWDRPIVLVTAPAGFGKSVLFQSLFATLYTNFQKAKKQLRRAYRPLPLLPDYAALASAPALGPMVDALLQTEVARPVKQPTFQWMLTRGFASWLLDGLDEVIAQDPDFFEYIREIVARPDNPTTPRILLCVRDSLLSSNQALRDFLAVAHEYVEEFRLLPWRPESIRTFARIRLQDDDHRLLDIVDAKPQLMRLCGTPYYAELLAERVALGQTDGIPDDYSEMDLVHDAVDAIMDREYKKEQLQENVVNRADLLDIISDVAVAELENDNRGVPVHEIGELAAFVLPADLSDVERERCTDAICRLPVFRAASERQRVRFAQDVIFEHQIGDRAARYFAVNPVRFAQLLDCRPFPPDSFAIRVLCARIRELAAGEELLTRLASATTAPTAFRNMLQVLLGLPDCDRLLPHAPLERQNLSGLTFANLSLAEVSFRGANLESTRFQNCEMAGCDLSDATLHGTRFDACLPSLAEADFGQLTGFVSVEIDSRPAIEDVNDFVRLLGGDGRRERHFVGPCPTALQLRFLFLKFVRPDGHYRRDSLDEKGLLSGRRIVDPASVLNGAVRAGFLTAIPKRRRYERTHNQLYADMVGFAQNLRVTPAIRALLEDTCRVEGCPHVVHENTGAG
ncbi:pentapeptide repeat-containing protein [Micromonospora sp. RV43]|uniref:pentapeptide repeat-containing protein n=1 Tax=Micromonospora sp. RV43 TaxID=1661387 RepID=UPI00064BBC25|nr:pentapeptide repeat-containing protein [Micromonospora sp. RV43]